MVRVYVEPSALVLAGGAGHPGTTPETERPAPGAVEAIENLRAAGFEVAMLVPTASAGSLPVERLPSLGLTVQTDDADHPRPGSWLVTADPRRCQDRLPGVRTVLLGPRMPPGRRPTAHCDLEARDLAAAVIEILTREAMT